MDGQGDPFPSQSDGLPSTPFSFPPDYDAGHSKAQRISVSQSTPKTRENLRNTPRDSPKRKAIFNTCITSTDLESHPMILSIDYRFV